ncbi:phospholipase-like protein [Tanacetum coccineum]|uniref:Phospholipase-like protein n=1 Tax=Tanacetum coccineum TaxID=301880 RepID=A0ABQ5HGV2_9ASTR
MMEEVFVKRLKEEVMLRVEKEKMVNYEREKNKRRHALMNSDHWKASTSRISNYVKPWTEEHSRPNRATDRVHLANVFYIYLGQRGLLRCRFPWCKDVCVDRRFWESLVYLDPAKKGWIMDEVFMPINETDSHWCLAQLDLQSGVVTFYDSGITYDPEWRDWYITLKGNAPLFKGDLVCVSMHTQYFINTPSFEMSDFIPIELQYDIINRLPVKSILAFRNISKHWKSYIDSSEFIQQYGCRETANCSFTLTYEQGFQSFMRMVNEDFQFTPLNLNLQLSCLSPIGTSEAQAAGTRFRTIGCQEKQLELESVQTRSSVVLSGTFSVGDIVLLYGWDLAVDGASVTSFSMLFSIPTTNSIKLIEFWGMCMEADGGSFYIGPYKESVILLNYRDRSLYSLTL